MLNLKKPLVFSFEYCDEKENKPCENAYFDKKLNNWAIELHSLDDLIKLTTEVRHELIIDNLKNIEIYDDYRE